MGIVLVIFASSFILIGLFLIYGLPAINKRDAEKEKAKQLFSRWINDMVDKGFNHGWMGDISQAHRDNEINYIYRLWLGKERIGEFRLIAILYGDCGNLKSYCGWSESEVNELLSLFGIKDMKQATSLYNMDRKNLIKVFHKNKYNPKYKPKAHGV